MLLWHWRISGPGRVWEQWADSREQAYTVALSALRGMMKLDRLARAGKA